MNAAVTPEPTTTEQWVAVLMLLARQLVVSGYDDAAQCVYSAAATFEARHG